MNWGSFSEFVQMGGYGLYVWGSYLVTTALIAIEVTTLASRHRAALRRLAEPLPEHQAELAAPGPLARKD